MRKGKGKGRKKRVSTIYKPSLYKTGRVLPETHAKAEKVKRVMEVYCDSYYNNGDKEKDANELACDIWEKLLGERCCKNTIYRKRKIFERYKGIENTPVEAFYDRKSCPHPDQWIEKRIPTLLRKYILEKTAEEKQQHPYRGRSMLYGEVVEMWLAGKKIPGVPLYEKGQSKKDFPCTSAQFIRIVKGI
jgi:hypothetical protein